MASLDIAGGRGIFVLRVVFIYPVSTFDGWGVFQVYCERIEVTRVITRNL